MSLWNSLVSYVSRYDEAGGQAAAAADAQDRANNAVDWAPNTGRLWLDVSAQYGADEANRRAALVNQDYVQQQATVGTFTVDAQEQDIANFFKSSRQSERSARRF